MKTVYKYLIGGLILDLFVVLIIVGATGAHLGGLVIFLIVFFGFLLGLYLPSLLLVSIGALYSR